MEDATRLISELQAKLAELDNRVAAYRVEMVTEFTRYSEELLQDVPQDIAGLVQQTISESLGNYPSLYPPTSQNSYLSPTPTNPAEASWRGRCSPPPILPHTSGTPKELPRSPHEREQEFQGVFTPLFLPLLDSGERPLHSPPTSPGAERSAGIDDNLRAGIPNTPEPTRRRRRPSPLRRTTDTSIDSAASDSSSAKIRKSALRRSSSSSSRPADSPRDPRRVRFDFQGQEVLPSSSPQPSTAAVAEAGSPSTQETSALADDSFQGTSLGDIEGEEDRLPKKVSSSQALRALSKAPLDKGTVWTVVNSETYSEKSSSVDADKVGARTDTASFSQTQGSTEHHAMGPKQTPQRPKVEARGQDQTHGQVQCQAKGLAMDQVGHGQPNVTHGSVEAEDCSSEDDSSLYMVSKKGLKQKLGAAAASSRNLKKPTLPTSTPSKPIEIKHTPSESATKSTTPTATPPFPSVKINPTGVEDEEEEEVEMFNLDADDHDEKLKKAIEARKSAQKHLPGPEDEEPERGDRFDEPGKMSKSHTTIPFSPPISIPMESPPGEIPPKVSPMPDGCIPPGTSIGSIGGRSLIVGPAKDREISEKLSQLDVEAIPFFVGSVNGRSGPDASNIKSYKASLQSPKGSGPGSFFERYFQEMESGASGEAEKKDRWSSSAKRRDSHTRDGH